MANIPGTSVPAVSFGDRGFVAPQGSAVLAGVQADFDAAFGTTLNYNLNTPQGQLSSSIAALVNNTNSIFVYYCNQVDPAYATGRMQDAIGRIYFLERNGAQPTTLQISCLGAVGVVIPVGATVVDGSGNIYACQAQGTIPSGGTVSLSFACTVAGPVPIPDGVSIYQAIPGWDAVSISSAVEGVDAETRAEFEQRRIDSVAGNSFGAIGSIIGAVAKVSGVVDYFGYDNGSNAPFTIAGVTVPANSIFVCVSGGADADVAQAILSKKGPGCSYFGNTSVTAYDSNPLYASPIPYTVTFERPSDLPVLFAVSIVNGPLVPADATAQVQNAIISAFGGGDGGQKARIGSTILATRFVAPIAALGPWALVSQIQIGSGNTPGASFVGRISGTTLTVDSVASGAVAIGQFVDDGLGLVTPATKITAGSGSSWTVNNSQNFGASFTGTGSGTTLTASGVTGTIAAGETVLGTGVPANTTIVQQLTGTPGGAGTYETSNATTSSGNALTSGPAMTGSTANQTQVAVRGDQAPSVVAGDVSVTLV